MATEKALNDIRQQIDRLRQIASRWTADTAVGDIERELMLDKLRRLYEEVLFLDWEDLSDESPEEAGGEEGISVPAPDLAAESAGEFAPEPAAEEPEPSAELIEETVVTVETSAEQKLFSDEPLVRTRVDKRVILSLYGDEPSVAPEPAVEPEPEPLHEPQIGQEPPMEPEIFFEPEPEIELPVEPTAGSAAPEPKPAAAPIGQSAPNKVLGEVIASQGEALGDVLGKQHAHEDVASRLRATSVVTLHSSIGINDRFQLMSELFGGDGGRYEETLAQLDLFTDLDEAMIYIQENFDWKPDSAGAQLLVDLLERKLGN